MTVEQITEDFIFSTIKASLIFHKIKILNFDKNEILASQNCLKVVILCLQECKKIDILVILSEWNSQKLNFMPFITFPTKFYIILKKGTV